jgi:hypothetical protein
MVADGRFGAGMVAPYLVAEDPAYLAGQREIVLARSSPGGLPPVGRQPAPEAGEAVELVLAGLDVDGVEERFDESQLCRHGSHSGSSPRSRHHCNGLTGVVG